MPKKKRFEVEKHSATEWRIVNDNMGGGLIYKSRKKACVIATRLNIQYAKWVAAGLTLPETEDKFGE